MSEELLDVITESGQATGIVKPKSLVHRDGDWHRAVHIWILTSDAQLLLQRRSAVKLTYPGMWDISCAGHVSAGESPFRSAVRELEEELGLRVEEAELSLLGVIVEQSIFHGGKHLENEHQPTLLLRRDVDPGRLVLQAEEVDEVTLIPVMDFRRRVARQDPTLAPHWSGYELLLATLA